MKSFSKREAIKYGWGAVTSRLGFFFGLMVVLLVIKLFSDAFGGLANQRKVQKEDFALVTSDVDGLYNNLLQSGYISQEGIVKKKFRDLRRPEDLNVDSAYGSKARIVMTMHRKMLKVPPSRHKFYAGLFVMWVISMIAQIGLIKITLKIHDDQPAQLTELFSYAPLIFKYLLANILYGAIIFAGGILLIIPGIIWAVMFQFTPYFIIDKDAGIMEALKSSASLTSGAKWNLFFFNILIGLVNLAGALCFLVGLLLTIPLSFMAIAYVYRQLLSQTGSGDSPEIPAVS